MKKVLNLGCGDNPILNAVNTDIHPLSDSVEKLDMSKIPYPYASNSFDEIHAVQIINVLCPLMFVKVIEEWYRILKPNGTLFIEHRYREDPFTRLHLSKNSFNYFNGGFYKNHTTAKFELIKYQKKRLWTHLRKIHIPNQQWELQAIK